jgi:hypothetical protein
VNGRLEFFTLIPEFSPVSGQGPDDDLLASGEKVSEVKLAKTKYKTFAARRHRNAIVQLIN